MMPKVCAFFLALILLPAFWVGLMLSPYHSQARASFVIQDPPGDAQGSSSFTDILSLNVSEENATITFALAIQDSSQGFTGAILLDLDGNRQTHGGTLDAITEAIIEFNAAILGIATAQFFDKFGTATDLECELGNNDFIIELPRSLIPDAAADFEVAALAASDFLCDGRDRIPDEGFANIDTGKIHVDNEGLSLNSLSVLNDSSGDSATPADLRGVTGEQQGEHLIFRVYYHHSIKPEDMDEVSITTLSLDLDGSIMTGFQNAAGIFPTFGVDAYFYCMIYHSAVGGKTEIDLSLQDPAKPAETGKVRIGKFSSDSCFRRSDNFIEISIPLGLLPAVTDDAVMIVDALTPLLSFYDAFPDNGGLLLKDISIRPFNSCATGVSSVTDPQGDSFGFGKDNDDFVEMRACHCKEGTLMVVKYSDFHFLGEAMTSMHLDTDQSASTGEQTSNSAGDTWMGIEKTLVYQLGSTSGGTPVSFVSNKGVVTPAGAGGGVGGAPIFRAIMVEGSSGDLIRGINQLFTLNFQTNEVYVTIPYPLLDDDGSMDVHAWSMSVGGGIPTFDDEIPDSGLFSFQNSEELMPEEDSNRESDGTGGSGGCFIGAITTGLTCRNK